MTSGLRLLREEVIVTFVTGGVFGAHFTTETGHRKCDSYRFLVRQCFNQIAPKQFVFSLTGEEYEQSQVIHSVR